MTIRKVYQGQDSFKRGFDNVRDRKETCNWADLDSLDITAYHVNYSCNWSKNHEYYVPRWVYD